MRFCYYKSLISFYLLTNPLQLMCAICIELQLFCSVTRPCPPNLHLYPLVAAAISQKVYAGVDFVLCYPSWPYLGIFMTMVFWTPPRQCRLWCYLAAAVHNLQPFKKVFYFSKQPPCPGTIERRPNSRQGL